MSLTGWICGASALLLTWAVYETLKNMIAAEVVTRLERLPYAILRLARRRLPAAHRETIHDEEWLPELLAIVRETDGLPITRLLRGVDFAIGLLLAAPKVSELLGRFRRKPPKPTPVTPDGIGTTVSLGEPTVGPIVITDGFQEVVTAASADALGEVLVLARGLKGWRRASRHARHLPWLQPVPRSQIHRLLRRYSRERPGDTGSNSGR